MLPKTACQVDRVIHIQQQGQKRLSGSRCNLGIGVLKTYVQKHHIAFAVPPPELGFKLWMPPTVSQEPVMFLSSVCDRLLTQSPHLVTAHWSPLSCRGRQRPRWSLLRMGHVTVLELSLLTTEPLVVVGPRHVVGRQDESTVPPLRLEVCEASYEPLPLWLTILQPYWFPH